VVFEHWQKLKQGMRPRPSFKLEVLSFKKKWMRAMAFTEG
jgi:hypothetical protein